MAAPAYGYWPTRYWSEWWSDPSAYSWWPVYSVPTIVGVHQIEVAMTLNSKAISQWAGFNFMTMAQVGKKFVGVNEDGLYEFSGSDDEGVDIDAYLEFVHDFGVEARVRSLWFGYEADGDLEVTVTFDDRTDDARTFTLASTQTGNQQHAEKLFAGRTDKGRYLRIKIANKDGSDFSMDFIEAVIIERAWAAPRIQSITVPSPPTDISLTTLDRLAVSQTLANLAVTQFENFNFDSVTQIGRQLVGVNETGLYLLGGDYDDTALIDSNVEFVHDFGGIVRVRSIIFAYETDGYLDVTLTFDDRTAEARTFTLTPRQVGVKQHATMVYAGRGDKGRYLRVKIVNQDSADFSIDFIRALIVPLGRRPG